MREKKSSLLCEEHEQDRVRCLHLVYEIYKRRKIVEACAVQKAHGNLDLLEHSVFAQRRAALFPGVSFPPGKRVTVMDCVLNPAWKDDLFHGLFEYFPRELQEGRGANLGYLLLEVLFPLAQEINGNIKVGGPFANCDYGVQKRPFVDLQILAQKLKVTCHSGEFMYRLSDVMKVYQEEDYHGEFPTAYAWTLPVDYVEGWNLELPTVSTMIRFEEIHCP